MEELLETMTWSQLKIHRKPIGILNINHYFDSFLKWMHEAVAENFIAIENIENLVVETDVERLMDALLALRVVE